MARRKRSCLFVFAISLLLSPQKFLAAEEAPPPPGPGHEATGGDTMGSDQKPEVNSLRNNEQDPTEFINQDPKLKEQFQQVLPFYQQAGMNPQAAAQAWVDFQRQVATAEKARLNPPQGDGPNEAYQKAIQAVGESVKKIFDKLSPAARTKAANLFASNRSRAGSYFRNSVRFMQAQTKSLNEEERNRIESETPGLHGALTNWLDSLPKPAFPPPPVIGQAHDGPNEQVPHLPETPPRIVKVPSHGGGSHTLGGGGGFGGSKHRSRQSVFRPLQTARGPFRTTPAAARPIDPNAASGLLRDGERIKDYVAACGKNHKGESLAIPARDFKDPNCNMGTRQMPHRLSVDENGIVHVEATLNLFYAKDRNNNVEDVMAVMEHLKTYFEEFYAKHGIQLDLTIHHNPPSDPGDGSSAIVSTGYCQTHAMQWCFSGFTDLNLLASLFVHELGHKIGGLVDEYYSSECPGRPVGPQESIMGASFNIHEQQFELEQIVKSLSELCGDLS